MYELSLAELTEALGSRTRALALRRWLYGGPPPAQLPARVPGVAPGPWGALRRRAALPAWRLRARQQAADGTVKYALDLAGAAVETVLIPARGRSTVCLSSQAGCTRHCRFCATATLGFTRNLSAGEILLQYALARSEAPAGAPARNVVFMGMGEPMDNLEAVLAAVERLTEEGRPGLGAAQVTVSTSGVLPGIRRFLRECRASLALSLNATTDAVRARLIPHDRTWPIAALLGALREDAARDPGRRYFIEYVLWDGVNDGEADAERLATLLAGLPAHVNLIPHNPFPGSPLRPSAPEAVRAFQRRLAGAGVRALVRAARGQDIAAACGQLALQKQPPLEPGPGPS